MRLLPNKPIIIFASVLACATLFSCGSDAPEEITIEDQTVTNVEIKSFSLQRNNRIASNIDSLFFAIDLNEGIIYNGDSLPVGTVPGKTLVTLELPNVSKAEIVSEYEDGESTTVDYLKNPGDSVDFAARRVYVRIVSANEQVMREYDVKLNIHRMKPDSLTWFERPVAMSLPGVENPTATRTVKKGGEFYTLTVNATGAMIAHGAHPAQNAEWERVSVVLPQGADVSTFTASGSAFYIVDGNGVLNSSADGRAWTETGVRMNHIYGAYGEKIVGVRQDGGTYTHVTYPAGEESPVSAECPVRYTSDAMLYDSKWSGKPMLTVTGGRRADGGMTGSTWGYDGTRWAALSVDPLPAREGTMVCEYFDVSVSSLYKVITSPVLIAFGGRLESGYIDEKIYMSVDRGVHWREAPAMMQETPRFPGLFDAQAFVSTVEYGDMLSRAVKPVTTWECPTIYVFGGLRLFPVGFSNRIYGGAINYFMMKPVI